MTEELSETEWYVLGIENKEGNDVKFFSNLFASYGYQTDSLKIIHRGAFLNLLVKFKKELTNKNSIDLPGYGEFEITKSIEKMKQLAELHEKDVSFEFNK